MSGIPTVLLLVESLSPLFLVISNISFRPPMEPPERVDDISSDEAVHS
jgi:hypothetical protein